MNVLHFDTNSVMSMPGAVSPKLNCAVLLRERSAVDTRSRESSVASEVCFTVSKRSFAFSSVSFRPVEAAERYSARESTL